MNKYLGLFALTLTLLSPNLFAGDIAKEKVKIDKYGMASAKYSSFGSNSWMYLADTILQICYIRDPSLGGYTTIPCSKLSTRDEWKPIITWTK